MKLIAVLRAINIEEHGHDLFEIISYQIYTWSDTTFECVILSHPVILEVIDKNLLVLRSYRLQTTNVY